MTQHFAASWLQSLEKKLEALSEWSYAADQRGECTTHRNLFREFFNPKFQKTLALVDDKKRIHFLERIEKNLFKFEGRTQQFPLGCLCSLLQHGKESPKTQETIAAWVNFLLGRFREALVKEVLTEAVEECLADSFQKFVPLMSESLMERFSDGLGEHLVKCDEELQKKVIESFAAVPERIETIMKTCTKELNLWLENAPRFPSTPLVLSDTLSRMKHPLVRFFNRIKDATTKESFLLSVALTLQGLRTRFRWMCAVEPELEQMGADLQGKLFTIEGQGSVMETWLQSRLKKYNQNMSTKASQLLITDPGKAEQLKARLKPLFPARSDADPNSGWVSLDGPSKLADAVLGFLVEHVSNFFVPQHTMARETLLGVLHRFGAAFETDAAGARVRLGALEAQTSVLPKPQFPPMPPGMPPVGAPSQALALVPPPPAGAPVISPPGGLVPVAGQQASALVALPRQAPLIKLPGAPEAPSAAAPEVNNLVDLLLSEELEPVDAAIRAKIYKVSQGVYRFGQKEVTLHTVNGQLFVYRVGMMVRNCPLKMLLQEEGLVPTPGAASTAPAPAPAVQAPVMTPPPGAPPPGIVPVPGTATAASAVDTSSVAQIASLSAKISAGVTTTTATAQQNKLPFGQSRPSDVQSLMSKRVEAATKAMELSKQIVRRSVNFDDEKFLRKLMKQGLKHDRSWSLAYSEFCNAKGIVDQDYKKQDHQTVATFIERNLASSMKEDWVRKVLDNANDEEKKEKKDKKEKKKDKKEKKDKKRKASESGSSSPERHMASANGLASAPPPMMQPPPGAPPNMQPPSMPPPPGLSGPLPAPDMPMGMHMFPPGMFPPGMMGQMGMGGMVPPFGPGMMGDGMPPMGMDMGDDQRARKKAKGDKAEKPKKAEKSSKNKR